MQLLQPLSCNYQCRNWHVVSDNFVRQFLLQTGVIQALVTLFFVLSLYQVFVGNSDWDIVVSRKLEESIVARFFRVHPVTWFGHIAMRVEFYGCRQGRRKFTLNIFPVTKLENGFFQTKPLSSGLSPLQYNIPVSSFCDFNC